MFTEQTTVRSGGKLIPDLPDLVSCHRDIKHDAQGEAENAETHLDGGGKNSNGHEKYHDEYHAINLFTELPVPVNVSRRQVVNPGLIEMCIICLGS